MTPHGRIAAISFGTAATVFAALIFLVSAGTFAHGQTFTVLHAFQVVDGLYPYAGPTLDSHGNIYGVTENGGLLNCDGGGPVGCGVVYKLTKFNSSWGFSLLFEFGKDTQSASLSQRHCDRPQRWCLWR